MRVIIVGAGKVGFALARHITKEGYDLVVIDRKPEKVDAITDAFDCNGYVGNGCCTELLRKCGIDSASVFVAVTKSDETNILCCSAAKKLGVKRTIAAVRGPEYEKEMSFLTDKLGVDLLINPDRAAAEVGIKMLRYAETVEREMFGNGTVHLSTVEICGNGVLAGVKLPSVQKVLDAKILICAIDRGGRVFTPSGQDEIKTGDKIVFAASEADMEKTLNKLRITERRLKKAVIVGASNVGYYMTGILLRRGIRVTVIDNDEARCRQMLNCFPKADIVNGDGTDSELMEKELKGADACVAATSRDEENLVISMFAKSFGTSRIAAVINNVDYETMLKKSGVNHVFSTQDVALVDIIKDMRQLANGTYETDGAMKWLYTLNSGSIEAAEFEVGTDFKLQGILFRDESFKLKPGILIAVIMRGGSVEIAGGNSKILPGDHVIVVSAEHRILSLADIVG